MSRVEVVPDAGMFIKTFPYSHQCLNTKKLKLGVNWASDRAQQRFPEGRSYNIMGLFFATLKEIAERYDAEIFIIEHLLKEPRNIIVKEEMHKVATEKLGNRVHFMYDETKEELFPPFDYTAPFFADIYRQMDLVFGMRGHANIIAFGQNTPSIGIGQHNKVKWFLEQVNLSSLLVTLDGDDSHIRLNLNQVADNVINNLNSYKQTIDNMHTQCAYIKDAAIDKIVKLIK